MKTPTFVFTGFLGSGKTTLISALLAAPSEVRTAVLVNEVGAVALDHHLVERVEGDVAVLASGCICCTVHGALSDSLRKVINLAPDRIVLETTGLANPAPVLHALSTDPELAARLRLGATIVAVDGLRSEPVLDAHPEARAQLQLADRVVITKTDLSTRARLDALHARVAELAPGAERLESAQGRLPPDVLLSEAPVAGLTSAARAARWLEAHPHTDHAVDTRVIELPSLVDVPAVALWLRLVTQLDGRRLLRVKGLVEDRDGVQYVLQSAGHAVAPLRTLEARPAGWTGSRLVMISQDLEAAQLDAIEAAALSAARGERRRARG